MATAAQGCFVPSRRPGNEQLVSGAPTPLRTCVFSQTESSAPSLFLCGSDGTGGCTAVRCHAWTPAGSFSCSSRAMCVVAAVLSEGLQEDLMQRRKATVQQRVAWISEALFQIAGPLPQMCRSDFLDVSVRMSYSFARRPGASVPFSGCTCACR